MEMRYKFELLRMKKWSPSEQIDTYRYWHERFQAPTKRGREREIMENSQILRIDECKGVLCTVVWKKEIVWQLLLFNIQRRNGKGNKKEKKYSVERKATRTNHKQNKKQLFDAVHLSFSLRIPAFMKKHSFIFSLLFLCAVFSTSLFIFFLALGAISNSLDC